MTTGPTIGELFRAKAISEEEIDTAVTSCVTSSPKEGFLFAGAYTVNLAAAVHALPQARERLSDPGASEFLKHSAVRTAIMLARPEQQERDPDLSSYEEAPMSDDAEPAEYDLRQEDQGWTVYNVKTGNPVRLNDAPQVGLTREVAEEIVQTLSVFAPGPDVSEEG